MSDESELVSDEDFERDLIKYAPFYSLIMNDLSGIEAWVAGGGSLLDFRCMMDDTILQSAARSGNPAIIRYLIANGCAPQLEMFDPFGRAPLHWAASYGLIDAMKALLDGGSKVDIRDDSHTGMEDTPLRIVIESGPLEVIQFLDGAGANWDQPGWMRLTPRHLAEERSSITQRREGDEAEHATREWLRERLTRK